MILGSAPQQLAPHAALHCFCLVARPGPNTPTLLVKANARRSLVLRHRVG